MNASSPVYYKSGKFKLDSKGVAKLEKDEDFV